MRRILSALQFTVVFRQRFRTFSASMSLIEMLMVMSIITILISLLLPSVAMVRERGRRTTCMMNLRQIGMTVVVYVDDHGDTFPPCVDYVPWRGSDYPGGVAALVNIKPQDIQACFTNYNLATNSAVWVCPSTVPYRYPAQPSGLGKFGMPASFGYKNNITYRWNSLRTRSSFGMTTNQGNMNSYPCRMSSATKSSQAALMWDLPDDLPTYNKPNLHQDRINCLFVDGHVDPIKAIPGVSSTNTLWWYVGNSAGEGWSN